MMVCSSASVASPSIASAGALSSISVPKLPPSCVCWSSSDTPGASRSTRARPPGTVTRKASAPAAIGTNILRPFSLPSRSTVSPIRSRLFGFSCHAASTMRSPASTGAR